MTSNCVQPSRLGFLHIPKSAAASLNSSIFTALGFSRFHVSKLLRHGEELSCADPNAISERTLAFRLACAVPYLPGHVTYSDLRTLERNYIFTVLRDPRKRAISMYTYALKKGELGNRGSKAACGGAIQEYGFLPIHAATKYTAFFAGDDVAF